MNNLSPKNKPVAPKSLKVNVINQLKHEKRMKRIFLLKSFSAAAAVIIVITVLAPFLISSNAKANSKEYISAAIDKIIHSNNLSIKFMVRTEANENFSYINPQNEFISTTFLRSFEAPFLWRIEKQNGRTALFNGEKIYIWNNGSNVGYINGKEGESGILEDYYTLLEPQNLLQRELAALSAKSVKASYESNDSIISLTISTKAQGSFENSYLLNSSIAESNSKRTYIFDKREKFLKAFTIDIKVKDRYITIVKSIEIKYSEMLDWSKLNSIPNIEWKQISQINENVSLKNISADQAAKFILSSLERSDFNSVSEAFTYYDAKFIKENYCGLKVISIGKSFKSGLYPGEFVPCTVVLKNGKRASTNIALRNDNQNKVWCIDGGI